MRIGYENTDKKIEIDGDDPKINSANGGTLKLKIVNNV